VPQLLSADGALTGRENVALFARLFDVPRRDRWSTVDSALDAMGLTEAADRMVKTYSGGMVRRLELAQALVNRPRLLILDEPTIGLDPVARAALWDKVTELRVHTGATVLVTTHYMEEAGRSGAVAAAAVPRRDAVPGRTAEAAPRPQRTGHPRHPAGAVAAHLRADV